jgi:hypothetical protein
MRIATLDLARDGAMHIHGAAQPVLNQLADAVDGLPTDLAGIRIHGIAALRPLLMSSGPIGAIARAILGPESRPVRAILFDKNANTNWSLGWHQDRTICVQSRVDVPGFGPWTVKQGMRHVTPPFDLLAGMITLRVHLDPVREANAPLLIAPGSHRFGRIAEPGVGAVIARCGTHACLADAGDIWVYATPILHASQAAMQPAHRRVLQIDYAARDLPGGLAWLGV